MNVHLYIHTGNAAFEGDDLGHELARIFREQAGKVDGVSDLADFNVSVRDVNGNSVGTFYSAGEDRAPDGDKPYLLASLEVFTAAFEDTPGDEVARILREAAGKLEEGNFDFGLRDYNGNRVGAVLLEAEEPAAGNDNNGGGGSDEPEPRDPLIGDELQAGNGQWWTVGRVEMVSNRNGTTRPEPLYLLVNNDEESVFDFKYANELKAAFGDENRRKFGYYVNLDERGQFNADVRDETGNSIFVVSIGQSGEEDESNPVEDGFMSHTEDIEGLAEYLADLGVMRADDELLTMRDFEKYQDRVTDLGIAAKEAYERSQQVYWYGRITAQESERAFLESIGVDVAGYAAGNSTFAVKLTPEAKVALEGLGTSFPADLLKFTDQDRFVATKELPVEDMPDEMLKPYQAFLHFAASGKADLSEDTVKCELALVQARLTHPTEATRDAGHSSPALDL
ncbi:hypothetical protein R70006_04950 [Paraburkholderia domus]|uniref:hypothetical protein n=1 Tax=Paraburkholderia domus TaxID=2793075 RepID=UPI0019127DD6|nr:hypothetical protein [Paraburkholderia domus]MBK5051814.1 hypothetical protein [Burkholderia sp. R-70006]CAE6793303.1 hypothetical protein R70006_04950 [Paraburkholderia domus]